MSRENRYNLVNLIVLAAATLWFFTQRMETGLFAGVESTWFLLLVGVVLTNLFLKFIRIYLIFFEKELSFVENIKLYCKIVPVSSIFPFKLGELFRMYCYGYKVGSGVTGVIGVLLDRFVDTAALLTVLFGVTLAAGGGFSAIFCVLAAFAIVILAAYLLFPQVYRFWNHHLLLTAATRRKLMVLRLLASFDRAYRETSRILRGKFMTLYILSLLAWGTELGGLFLLCGSQEDAAIRYLTAVLTGGDFLYGKQFMVVSLCICIAIYLILKIRTSAADHKRNGAQV